MVYQFISYSFPSSPTILHLIYYNRSSSSQQIHPIKILISTIYIPQTRIARTTNLFALVPHPKHDPKQFLRTTWKRQKRNMGSNRKIRRNCQRCIIMTSDTRDDLNSFRKGFSNLSPYEFSLVEFVWSLTTSQLGESIIRSLVLTKFCVLFFRFVVSLLYRKNP